MGSVAAMAWISSTSSVRPRPLTASVTTTGPLRLPYRQILADVLQGQTEQHVVDGVGLGDDDDEFMYAKKGQDVEMFFRLRHDPFVGIDDEQDQIEARQAGDHILDELFMTRHIDDAGPRTVRQVEPGKAQVDGQSPFLFFRCRIRIDPGQARTSVVLP